MSEITKETLQLLLEKCITLAVHEAQKEVVDPLPTRLYLGLESFGQRGKELSLDEVMSFLFRNGTFPRVVDVAVRGIKDERTFIWIRPSGHHYVNDFAQTWNTPVGMGPFKIITSALLYHPPRPLSALDLREARKTW